MNRDDVLELGFTKVTPLTYPNTFVQVKYQNFDTAQVTNRDSASWKKGQVIEIADPLTEEQREKILAIWTALNWEGQYLILQDEYEYYELLDYKAYVLKEGNEDELLDYLPRLLQKSNTQDIKFVGGDSNDNPYRPYITAIKTKPFLLLAGISGTGKSRIVRELARACWGTDSEEYKAQKPRNFEMVQVKPNWHDSSELIGYVSRIGEHPTFVSGDFIKFVARAWAEPDMPYFLCLDEMNLAPVEQYFAEFLSVVESRKADANGTITTDPLLKKSSQQWYYDLCASITEDETLRQQFLSEGLALPQNLIVVGTVNMDETTFSFSRKVLDRAMTIEMNEVDLKGGLTSRYEPIGKLNKEKLIATAVEGVDIYEENQDVCDIALDYLQAINNTLEGTPFKIAYRTRNEILLYVVNNLPYNKDAEDNEIATNAVIAKALDEVTSMKILSRIEGDDTKVAESLLNDIKKVVSEGLTNINEEFNIADSISILKLEEMTKRLSSGYTNFWS